MAASAGTVTLDLDANSVKLLRELNKAQNSTKRTARRMRSDMKQAFTSMARNAALFGTALAAATKVSIDFADNIGKTADKIGVGVEALQEFRFAAKRTGLEQRTLDMALQRFTRRAAEAANGTGEAKAALEELGIQLRDANGNIRKSEDLLMDVADAMKQVRSPADRLRLAFKLFDSEGAGMVNMLRDGSRGLGDLRQKARDLGVVMSEDLVRNAERAADKMEDLNQVLKVNIAKAVTENAESIITLTNALISFVAIIGKATKGWSDWLTEQGVGVDTVDEIRRRGAALLAEKQEIERKLAEDGGQRNFLERLTGTDSVQVAEWKNRLAEITEEMMRLQEQAKGIIAEPMSAGSAEAPERGAVSGGTQSALAQSIAYINQELAKRNRLEQEYQTLRAENALNRELQELEESFAYIEDQLANRNELEREYQALLDLSKTALDTHKEQLARIHLLYQEGIIPSVDEYAAALQAANERFAESQEKTRETATEMDQFAIQAARNIQSQFADFLFNPFDEGLDGMLKGFAQTVQRMIAEAAAAQILKSLFGDTGGGDASSGLASIFANIFGGGKALGGPVAAGVPYLVGERGPELIVPQTAGTVVPNDKLGGKTIVNNFNFRKDPRRKSLTAEAAEINRLQRQAEARNR